MALNGPDHGYKGAACVIEICQKFLFYIIEWIFWIRCSQIYCCSVNLHRPSPLILHESFCSGIKLVIQIIQTVSCLAWKWLVRVLAMLHTLLHYWIDIRPFLPTIFHQCDCTFKLSRQHLWYNIDEFGLSFLTWQNVCCDTTQHDTCACTFVCACVLQTWGSVDSTRPKVCPVLTAQLVTPVWVALKMQMTRRKRRKAGLVIAQSFIITILVHI